MSKVLFSMTQPRPYSLSSLGEFGERLALLTVFRSGLLALFLVTSVEASSFFPFLFFFFCFFVCFFPCEPQTHAGENSIRIETCQKLCSIIISFRNQLAMRGVTMTLKNSYQFTCTFYGLFLTCSLKIEAFCFRLSWTESQRLNCSTLDTL